MRIHRPAVVLAALLLASSAAIPAAGQSDGEAVPYVNDEGVQIGSILIRGFEDPFTGHDPASPPAEGSRYAMLDLVFEAAEDQPFPTDPYQVQLLDSNGYVYTPGWVPRPPDAGTVDLQSQTLSPFDRVSGSIPYVLPEAASIVSIVFRGDGRRLMPIADLADAGAVAIGEPRPITDATGTTLGTVTLRDVQDPFVDHEPSDPPAEGQRYVLLDLAYEAAEDHALGANPGGVGLVDTEGRLYWPTGIRRPEPFLLQQLQATPLSPTDRISGVLGFVLPQAAQVAAVVYAPEANRFMPLADL